MSRPTPTSSPNDGKLATQSRLYLALVHKDLILFLSNRRELVLSFVVPIALASFMGVIFAPRGGDGDSMLPGGVSLRVVDEDQSDLSRGLIAALKADPSLVVTTGPAEAAREDVLRGQVATALILPSGFAERAVAAFFGGTRPEVALLYDPSRSVERDLVRGLLTQHVMELVSRDALSNPDRAAPLIRDAIEQLEANTPDNDLQTRPLRGMLDGVLGWLERPAPATTEEPGSAVEGNGDGDQQPDAPMNSSTGFGFNLPFEAVTEAIVASRDEDDGPDEPTYNSYAFYFTSMGVQYIFFAAIDSAVGLLEERRRGLWKRIRSAPMGRSTLLAAKMTSMALIAALILGVVFAFGMAVFGVRVEGSWAGFGLLLAVASVLSSSFGLLLAALGGTPRSTRLMGTFVVLVLAMLGGAWIPAFLFPDWMQTLTRAMPTRWAIDGFNAMTWRGLGFADAGPSLAAMLSFSVIFVGLALSRFGWNEP